ncbi:hypothetical protein TGFOU_404550 [Toxoplasma gondii FOU]|uniref:Uncharacterized protein n=1 Tax=Toxoplasma gondii FOU TaxID=943167 RepID=A0A086L0G1_TOXGO|nr:hypothetical protein TGFOU_404550 [Toxoplasma gondii FOU]
MLKTLCLNALRRDASTARAHREKLERRGGKRNVSGKEETRIEKKAERSALRTWNEVREEIREQAPEERTSDTEEDVHGERDAADVDDTGCWRQEARRETYRRLQRSIHVENVGTKRRGVLATARRTRMSGLSILRRGTVSSQDGRWLRLRQAPVGKEKTSLQTQWIHSQLPRDKLGTPSKKKQRKKTKKKKKRKRKKKVKRKRKKTVKKGAPQWLRFCRGRRRGRG